MEYPSIDSVFKRDTKGRFLPEYSCPEFEYLAGATWTWTEKVDGTNIRLYYPRNTFQTPATIDEAAAFNWRDQFPGNEHRWVKGRTDGAQIPSRLLNACVRLLRAIPLADVFPDLRSEVVLYGEGYGPGIQKGGLYRSDVSFVLFDVKVGDWWLRRPDVEDVAIKLGIDVVPVVNTCTLTQAVELMREQGSGREAWLESQWPGAHPEGIVGRPAVDLWNRKGDRIITKLKFKDFH